MSPYFAFAKKVFLNRGAYRSNHIFGILNTCLQIFIFRGIYEALYGGNVSVDGITLSMVTTNFVLSMCLGAAFSTDDFFLPNKIRDGSIANELLKPVSFRIRMIAENCGGALFGLIFQFLPAFLIAVFTIGILPPVGIIRFFLFIFSALLGCGILWTISFLVQTLAFWFVNVWSIVTITKVFINVLSGAMLPLWFMPGQMSVILKFTPFSSIYFTPVQIYLGQLSEYEILTKCIIQIVWILILYFLGEFLWRLGQRKLVVQGG